MIKKLFLIGSLFLSNLLALPNYYIDKNISKQILTYKNILEINDNIKNPFYKVIEQKEIEVTNKKIKMKKYIKINILSILDKNIFLKYTEYKGNNINSIKIWVKPGENFGVCKYIQLKNEFAIFKCSNKIIKKYLQTKINIKFN